ncbi:MAG: hypothetical protein AM326_07545 [Candidatus Thorarchaeota archaeon SMTZ-45]|nr:MAG: hypothetical protein AM325_15530 [Candidatus Thorarchaeota archaeon SMTZ1-45]KXH76172.1 MAG: hypothetical protein AM326_07545 [Candidatus Thorarchaeota archaeon SMTZ-45]
MREPYSILVAGVGGQGNLVCGRIISEATMKQGLRPIVGDTFGASRRGGSVVTHIRIGTRDWGPLIPRGKANIILGLEPVEALRTALRFAGKDTIAIVSMMPVPPSNVTSGNVRYPDLADIKKALESICQQVYMLDTEPVMKKLGSTRVLNSYMIGAFSALDDMPLDSKYLRQAILDLLESEMDLTAFNEGTQSLL